MSVNAMKRMGSQSLGGNDLVAQAVQRGKPAVFKVVDPDPGWVQRLHQASPQTVLVGRIVDNSLAGRLTAAEGRNFAGRVLARARELQDTIRWWEGSNEAASGPDAIKRLCEFERTFAERLQAEGYHALVGGFSTGVPQIVGPDGKVPWMGEWELFYPAMQIADGVHFHEYWNPKELDDRWNAYRFTMWWDALPAWAREKWWLVSELGVDGGLAEIDARKGWSDYIDGGRYLNLLNAYAQTLEHYPRIATAIYVTGLGADTSWRTYDICHTPVLDTLTAAWASVPPVAWGTAVPAPVLLAPDARNLIGQLPVRQGTQGYTGSRRLADIDIFLVHWLGAAGQDLTPETVWQDQVTHQDAGREQFPAGAFTFQVRQDGSLAQLHSLTTVTWQTQGTDPVTGQFVNDISIGVALEPERGAQGYRWTGPQIKTCQALYHWLCQTLGRNLRVLGHNEATPPTQTDCPGPAWPAQLKPQLMGGTEGGEGSPPPAPVTTVWGQAAAEAWNSVVVDFRPEFSFPQKALLVFGAPASPLSEEQYFEVGGLTWVQQVWTDGAAVKMLLAIKGQFGMDQIRALPFPTRPLAALEKRTGETITRVNLRTGPDGQQGVARVLQSKTPLEVLAESGTWLQVRAEEQEGYVQRQFILLPSSNVPAGFFKARSDLAQVPLAPAGSDKFTDPGADPQFVDIWNRYGGLLAALSQALRIDPLIAAAVLQVESGLQGFENGRLVIRFEPHVFYDHWGKGHPDQFNTHFWLNPDPNKFWWDHKWRPAGDQEWRPFHGKQKTEWEAFQFACTLDDTAAKLATSMGATQIMGFNYAAIGYEDVQQMFTAFTGDERYHILGIFDYIKGPGQNAAMVQALQQQDYATFARGYNGAGQADAYAVLINDAVARFSQSDISFTPDASLRIPQMPPKVKRR